MADDAIVLEVGDRQVRLSSPDKVLFRQSGWRKRDVVDHYLAVADATVVHLRDRPCVLKRFPSGVAEPFFSRSGRPRPTSGSRPRSSPSRAATTPRKQP